MWDCPFLSNALKASSIDIVEFGADDGESGDRSIQHCSAVRYDTALLTHMGGRVSLARRYPTSTKVEGVFTQRLWVGNPFRSRAETVSTHQALSPLS